MNINELTIGQAREIASMVCAQNTCGAHPWQIGKPYFIRTVTHHYTGRLTAVYDHELVLEQAAWIADDGRFTQAIATGTFDEVEPYPDDARVIIGRNSVIDAVVFNASLPRSQK